MTEILRPWLLVVGGGGLVAAVYFASLWWTVQRVSRARHPALLVAGSYLMRALAASLALLGIAAGDASRLLAAFAGFLVVRMFLVRSVRAGASLVPTARAFPEKRRW